jgi:hypothetical protein
VTLAISAGHHVDESTANENDRQGHMTPTTWRQWYATSWHTPGELMTVRMSGMAASKTASEKLLASDLGDSAVERPLSATSPYRRFWPVSDRQTKGHQSTHPGSHIP